LINDVIAESERRFSARRPCSADAVREAGEPLVGFSAAMAQADSAIKGFLLPRMYRHERIMRIMDAARGIVRDLFTHYLAHPDHLPAEWAQDVGEADAFGRARRVADFVAGMTDRYALIDHARHFDSTPELV
jgi:dGTPase